MYRFITKSSPIIRQTTSRITRQYSTRSSSSATNAFNSKYLVGVLVPTLLAVGYLTQVSSNTSAIQNASVADHIREDFAEGDALAKDAQERLEITQTKLQKEQEAEAIKKDEKEAIEKAEKKETIQQEKKQQQQPESTKKDGHNKSEPKPESGSGSESESESGEPKQEAAFNPDTGEINWDCPCLGGMAHGPCGEEFKEAFSCFVFSETEPKGIDCIKKFENMRSCFKRYPEHYRDELYDDGEDEQQSTEATEHIVLETTEPAVQEIEQGIEEHKVKTQKSTN